jgi:hypothetical protein
MSRKPSQRTPGKRVIDAKSIAASRSSGEKNTMYEKGRVTGKEYIWTLKSMPATDIPTKLKRSIHNQRSPILTKASVADILPSIEKDGQNEIPGYVVGGKDGVGEVLVGWRRSYAVSLVENGFFQYWYCESVDELDQKAKCRVADLQRSQSPGDRVLSLRELEKDLGQAVENSEVALEWGTSERYVRLIRSFMAIPDEIFSLFSDASLLTKSFLETITKLDLTESEMLERISDVEPIPSDISDEDEIKSLARKKHTEVINALKKTDGSRKLTLPPSWKIKSKEGVKIKAGMKGLVNISVDTNRLSEKEQESLRKLLAKQE